MGALIALAPQRRAFLPRDVDLLSSYGVQAAIALVNARLFEMQERLAAHDPLTGLLNRRELDEHVSREIDRCRRHGGGFSLVLVDLDGFKLVNDTAVTRPATRYYAVWRRPSRRRPGAPT